MAAHMALSEGTPEAIMDETVVHGLGAELYTISEPSEIVRDLGHGLKPTGHCHLKVTGPNRLRREHHSLKSRPTDLVDRDSRHRGRKAAMQGRLTGRCLPGSGLDDVAHNDLFHRCRINTGARHGGSNHVGP
jgi:hypothetical protein